MKPRQAMPGVPGFTLIEMVLAIGVSSIVLITVSTALFTALHLRAATAQLVDAATPMDQTFTFLRRDLQCLVTPTNGTSKILSGGFRAGDISSVGVGEPVVVEMITATGTLSESQPWGDLQRVTYGLRTPTDRAATGRDLVRSVTRNLLSVSTPDVTDQLMLSGVASVRFSGYDGAQWQPTWDTTATTSANTNLPLAVRVEILMAGNNNLNAEPIQMVVPVDAVARTNMVLTTTQ